MLENLDVELLGLDQRQIQHEQRVPSHLNAQCVHTCECQNGSLIVLAFSTYKWGDVDQNGVTRQFGNVTKRMESWLSKEGFVILAIAIPSAEAQSAQHLIPSAHTHT